MNDPNYGSFHECGSTTMNSTILGYLAVVSFVILIIVGISRLKTNYGTTVKIFYYECIDAYNNVFDDGNNSKLNPFITFVQTWTLIITSFATLVMLPTYAVLSHYYSSQTYKYAWIISSAYLQGLEPTIAFIAQVITLIVLSSLTFKFFTYDLFETVDRNPNTSTQSQSQSQSQSQRKVKSTIPSIKSYIVFTCMILFNVAIVLGVNAGFVNVVMNYRTSVVTAVNILLSLFKLTWNNVIVRASFGQACKLLKWERSGKDIVAIETIVFVFNNILAPCIAVGLMSPTCFYNLLFTSSNPSGLSACTNGYVAENNKFVCTANGVYYTPFFYSYECASSCFTTYAPVFLFMFIETAFIAPILQLCIMYFHQRLPENSIRFKIFCIIQPKMLCPPDFLINTNKYQTKVKLTSPWSLIDMWVRVAALRKPFQADVFVIRLVSKSRVDFDIWLFGSCSCSRRLCLDFCEF